MAKLPGQLFSWGIDRLWRKNGITCAHPCPDSLLVGSDRISENRARNLHSEIPFVLFFQTRSCVSCGRMLSWHRLHLWWGMQWRGLCFHCDWDKNSAAFLVWREDGGVLFCSEITSHGWSFHATCWPCVCQCEEWTLQVSLANKCRFIAFEGWD